MRRPVISAEIRRAILVEAGHRCSVCGVPCPLERAHIVAWRRTRDDSPENLVCLCANCHERADQEQWGEKTLREYKAHPWVMRQNGLETRAVTTTRVRITIDKDFDRFGDFDENVVRHAIANFLEIAPGSVRIIAKRRGSTVVEVELSTEDAARLLESKEAFRLALPLLPVIDMVEVQGAYTGLVIQNAPQAISSSRLAEALEVSVARVIWALGSETESSTLTLEGRYLSPYQKEELETLEQRPEADQQEVYPFWRFILNTLTERQRTVLRLAMSGYRLEDVTARLRLSKSLVYNELKIIRSVLSAFMLPESYQAGNESRLKADLEQLSPRESQIFALIGTGASYEQAGDTLGLRATTVRAHVTRICRKLRLTKADRESLMNEFSGTSHGRSG